MENENKCNEIADKVVENVIEPIIKNTEKRIINFAENDLSPSLKKANDNAAEFIVGVVKAMVSDIFKRKD